MPARKLKLVDTVKADWKVSIRRACAVLRIDRSLYVYKSRRGEQAELKLKITESGGAKFFSKRGITVVEIAMPYHFERSRPGSAHADYMLSPNFGRTIQSIRQAVWDARKLIRWLKSEGYEDVSVLGMSLGSWGAGLVAAHDLAVSKASLFMTAGSLADMVWSGRATRAIRHSLAPDIQLTYLRRVWV